MDRRDFIKLAGITGMGVSAAAALPGAWAFGDDADTLGSGRGPVAVDYEGPMFVMVQAIGGWDPTMLCDPKSNLNNLFGEGDILTAGTSIRYAPIQGAPEFFGAHASKTMVLNGVDMATNSHEPGQRNTASGRLAEGYPNLAALVAGVSAPHLPMSFLTFGGYDRTQGVVAPTRDGNQDRLAELAWPDRITPTDELSPTYHQANARSIIDTARRERAEALAATQRLPRLRGAVNTLMTARLGSEQLSLLQEVLPVPDASQEFRRVQLMMAAYKAGIAVAGNIARGGFDTHDNHDANHRPAMTNLMALVNRIWQEAELQGVADRLVVMIGSDFGRTPSYNGDAGKDHWPVSSMMLMGQGVPGGVTVGASDDGHNPRMLDPATLEPTDDPAVGVRLQPRHVHAAVRRLLGVEGSAADAAFPLAIPEEEVLDILA
jgi:hypothetical protein